MAMATTFSGHSMDYGSCSATMSVNKAYVDDEDNTVTEKRSGSAAPPKSDHDMVKIEVDYSKARKPPQFAAALAATLGAYILGCYIGWGSPCQPQLQQIPTATVKPTVTDPNSVWYIKLSDFEMSWVGSLINAGALIGALTGGALMDRFGRKMVLTFMSVPFAVGWLLVIVAVDPSMLYIGRLLGGFAGGICSVVAPSYVGEIAIPSMRGLLGFFFQLMVVTGILITSLFGLGLDWRLISAISAIDPLLFLLAMIYAPESPYYLVKKGKVSEAKLALKWLRGDDYDIGPEMMQMEARVRIELAQTARLSDLCAPWAYKPVLVAIGLMVFQQLSGINAALFNAVAIFETAGSGLDNLVSAVLLNVTQLVVTLISSMLVERLGRRTLFLISEIFMVISMFALGAFFYIKDDPNTSEETLKSLGWLPLTSLVLFIAAFGVGAGPMPWLMFGEILPAKVKGPGSSVASFTNWFLAFIVTLTFVDIQKGIGSDGAFWMFGSFCVVGALFTIFLLPETKGKTPEQIQAFFGNKSDNDRSSDVSPS